MTIDKTWLATSRHPRQSHSDISGETVKVTEEFGNGLNAPGDPSMGPEEGANCACIMFMEGKVKRRGEFKDPDAAARWGKEWSDPILKEVDDDIRTALKNYKGSDYVHVNRYLRGRPSIGELPARVPDEISKLDELFTVATTPEDVTAFRYVKSIDWIPEVGAEFTDAAYVSTTLNQSYILKAAKKGFSVEVRIPGGTNAIYYDAASRKEWELILSRGRTFRVLEKTDDSVVLEVVG